LETIDCIEVMSCGYLFHELDAALIACAAVEAQLWSIGSVARMQ